MPSTKTGFNLRLLSIPFSRCRALVESEQDLFARPLHVVSGHAALFADTFNSVIACAPRFSRFRRRRFPRYAGAARPVWRVARPRRESERSRAAIRAGLLRKASRRDRAQHSPDRPLARPGRSPPRHLDAQSAPAVRADGRKLPRTVTRDTAREACRLLQQDTARPVSDVAFSCGFESLATFYRVFRRAIGMTPTDYRLSLIERPR